MTDYRKERYSHFWEYELTDSPHGVKTTWQRYDPTAQRLIFDALFYNEKLALLKIEDTNFEIIFDLENRNHRHRDVKTGSECAVRMTPEVIVDDWNVFKAMVDVSKITKLELCGYDDDERLSSKINDNDAQELVKKINDCKSLRILELWETNLTDAFGVALAKVVATHTTLATLDIPYNKFEEETGVALGEALTTNTSLHTLLLQNNELREKGGAAIIRGLENNTTLRVLDLSSNNFGENFGVAIQDDLANNTGIYTLKLDRNNLGEQSGAALVGALTQNSTLTELYLDANSAISPATRAKIKFALSPELKDLLNDPSVSPSRTHVCVVGFDNVGKTELVNTWHRTTAHGNPHLDPEETAKAKPDNLRNKTSGISVKPITLRLDTMPPSSTLETPSEQPPPVPEGIPKTVAIIAWDFAGHTQYYLSHELLMRACRGAVFVLLFRIDSLQPDVCHAEQQRLFFWLKFIASMCSNQQQPPTVFISGSFRPDHDSFDVDATTEWTDFLLQRAKEMFDGVLNLPQHSIYHMDCRKSNDPHVTALRNTLAQAVEELRTREDRKVPPICEYATSLLHNAAQEVTLKLELFAKHMKSRLSNPDMPMKPLSWQDTVYSPIMTRADFDVHVLGKLQVKADGMGADAGFVFKLYDRIAAPNCFDEIPTIAPKSKQLLQIITTYLHDVGDILWFDVDGLRDTVILTPDHFCSKIIGAIFRPDSRGFSIDAVHGGGGLMSKSNITLTFKRALGIDNAHVDATLAILCQLGLCYQHQDPSNGIESYLFPGALGETTFRHPEWFGPLPRGQHFVVGRRFTLVDPTTTVFTPGCMSHIQVWALGRYRGLADRHENPMIWRDGVIIPYTATQSLAEAGVQLHRPHGSLSTGSKFDRVSISSITLVVRGSHANAKEDCAQLLNDLCLQIRTAAGVEVQEEALSPTELAHLGASKGTNMLDSDSCHGCVLSTNSNLDDPTKSVQVNGKSFTVDALRSGTLVPVPSDFGCDVGLTTEVFSEGVASLINHTTNQSDAIKQHATNQSNTLKQHVTEQTTNHSDTIKQHVTNQTTKQSDAFKQHVTEQTNNQTTTVTQHVTNQTKLVTAHITSESSLTRELLTRLETKLSEQLVTAFESDIFKRVVQRLFVVSASELGENIRANVQSDISKLQTQLTTTSTVSTTRETETRQHVQQLEQSITNLCANINTLDLNTTTSIANVSSSVANVDALVAEVGASLHQLVLSKKTPWLFFIVKDSTSFVKYVYRVHLLCNGTKHCPPHFLFKSMKDSEPWRRGFKLTELKLLSKYALKAALSVLSLVVAAAVASTVPPLLALITPGLSELLSVASDKAIKTEITKYTQALMNDLQQLIPDAEDDAAQHMQERSVGFDMSSSPQVGDATVTAFALEGDTQQHHVKTRRGLGDDENFTITVSGSNVVWVGVKNFKKDAAEVATIFDLDKQLPFPTDPNNINVVLTRKDDKLLLSWDGHRGPNIALALTPLGLDEEWVPVVATNDAKCRAHIVPPSFPYMDVGEIFEDLLVEKNKNRLSSKRTDNQGYQDWCGLSYYNNPPGGFGDGKGTPLWICQECLDKEKNKPTQNKNKTPTPSPKTSRRKRSTRL